MNLSENAITVLEKRYLTRDENLNLTEDSEGLFHRVAKAIAQGDSKFDEKADVLALEKSFYNMMTELDFLPNSPTLMNAGRPLGQLSACFVLPVGDSMEEIFEAIKQAALIHKSGGGTGFSFSRLRAAGSVVKSTGGVASGPISFMKVFNMATEAVKQGGTRRGANMGILRIDHPDILEFIDCKNNNNNINNFNISVGITEAFMQAVQNGESYDIIDPSHNQKVAELDARLVFEKIVASAWKNGEPGIIFLDRLNKDNIVPSQGEIESTNPCGEQPLLPYESCNLGSINLVKMAKEIKSNLKEEEEQEQEEQVGYEIDYVKLENIIRLAVHFLDNVIEINQYPLKEIERVTKQTRKIGLGIMGWADLLLILEIAYDSDEAVCLAQKVMGFINKIGHEESARLANIRGAFPLFEESIYDKSRPLRNATVTTIAPTGTISILAGCSSGVEPVFAYAFVRNVMDNTEMLETNPILKNVLLRRGLYKKDLMQKIIAEGTLQHIPEIPDEIKKVFVCAHDISPMAHVKMQAAFQKHTDNAVSKTVNFTNDATKEDVAEVYTLAYKLGCKGVTIYRDGSRELQVLNIGKVNKNLDKNLAKNITPRERPAVTEGITERMRIGCGNLYVTVNYDQDGICEVFTSTGKAGGCPSQSEATARLASIALRSGIDVNEIIHQLQGIRCPSTIRQQGVNCTSCPDAIAKVLLKVCKILEQKGASKTLAAPDCILEKSAQSCPECGMILEHEGGCISCPSCGYSKCN